MSIETLLKKVKLGSEAAFPKKEFDRRVGALQAILRKKGIDLFMTSGAENIFYLCGQQTPGYYMFQCLFVPAKGTPFLVMRGLERFNARANSYLEDIQGYSDTGHPAAAVVDVVKARGWKGKKIAVDRNAWFLTVNIYERLSQALGKTLDGSDLVESLRRVKSPLELESMKQSGIINDAGMRAGLAAVRPGVTENDVAAATMGALIAAGSEYLGMEPFVTSGPRSGHPHSTWRRRKLEDGDMCVIETAGCYNRYHVASFRSVAIGNVPQKCRDWYKICLEALETGVRAVKPGVTAAYAHDAVQKVIDRHGVTDSYRKRLGYSLGISFAPDWGEGNILSLNAGVNVELKPGMTFHVPITLRDYGKFTVAVSESVIVTSRGCEQFGKVPRDLVQV
ncbi:MAG: aminopeptidase P family protein [Rhodospirillales bacterium]|nr:aminopeptidase P family protein [Rhodospirillales bacterium]